jgi:hypothetical protein
VEVRRCRTAADRRAFVDLVWPLYRDDPAWVPPLKAEVHGLLNPRKNPWFEHGRAELWLAWRDGRPVGRISAQVDSLVERHMGSGTGQWGFLEAQDEEAAAALLRTAEDWLRAQGMTRALGPFSLSVWDEVGLEISGFAEPPTVMMPHHKPAYADWVERAGHRKARDLLTFELDIAGWNDPLIARLIAAGERNPKLRIRTVDKRRFDRDAAIILGLLNDAWSANWGFVPLTEAEIAYAARKLKPVIFEPLVRIAELDEGAGFKPMAFMMTLPDINELIRDLDGRLLPFNWARLLWRLRRPRTRRARVPLMGVASRLHNSRLASQLAFMLIEHIRRSAVADFGISVGEFGWVLEDNKGMLSIAESPGAAVNHVYRVYEKAL